MQEVTVRLNREIGPIETQLNFPTTWNELTRHQLLFVAKHWTIWQSLLKMGEPILKIRAMLVIILSDLKGKRARVKLCETLAFVDENSGGNILECSNFIFEKIDLTKNILPTVNVGWFKQYVGPSNALGDISIEEFSFAFGIYNQFEKTKNTTLLPTLMAVLYRPADKNFKRSGENRLPFNNKLIEVYAKHLAKMPDFYHQAVYLFFVGCLEHLAKRYTNVFKRADSASGSGGTFFDTLVAISGGKFGPFESTKKTNLYIVLQDLDQQIKNQAKR